jgi:hypothetical protein
LLLLLLLLILLRRCHHHWRRAHLSTVNFDSAIRTNRGFAQFLEETDQSKGEAQDGPQDPAYGRGLVRAMALLSADGIESPHNYRLGSDSLYARLNVWAGDLRLSWGGVRTRARLGVRTCSRLLLVLPSWRWGLHVGHLLPGLPAWRWSLYIGHLLARLRRLITAHELRLWLRHLSALWLSRGRKILCRSLLLMLVQRRRVSLLPGYISLRVTVGRVRQPSSVVFFLWDMKTWHAWLCVVGNHLVWWLCDGTVIHPSRGETESHRRHTARRYSIIGIRSGTVDGSSVYGCWIV